MQGAVAVEGEAMLWKRGAPGVRLQRTASQQLPSHGSPDQAAPSSAPHSGRSPAGKPGSPGQLLLPGAGVGSGMHASGHPDTLQPPVAPGGQAPTQPSESRSSAQDAPAGMPAAPQEQVLGPLHPLVLFSMQGSSCG